MTVHARLYKDFTEWKKKRREHAKKKDKALMRTGEFQWYNPNGEFDVSECASEYSKMLKEGAYAGDVMAVRFQAAQILACQQAWLHRHCSIARLLTHGYTENVVEANGLYDKYLDDVPSGYIKSASQQRSGKTG